ncbi:DUF5719 family protein [Gryllotalpicola protaetiae]|uniref:Large extracellular alpha-helical protein n=1 Tax=Gryllotalpicola protaetiae TaxID=2419771 RepID=A0A387BKA6_9MICO|nr:DUF5719 family protein [Gryllotalpicola protaetiae]AYG04293.1 hypothetical protein D7I44_12660 [Gryllotalpicola protaetiae]
MATDRRTTLTRAGVRVLAGAAGLAASAAVAVAAFTLPLPSAQAQPVSRTVTPVPAAATVACPGPVLALGSSASTSGLSALGAPTVVSGGDGSSPASIELTAADVTGGGAGPGAFQQPASSAQHEPLLAAAQSYSANSADLRGLAAANCAQPDFEQWLVGGATSLGATTLVILTNPGDVAATVSIDVYFEQGKAAAAGGRGIVVQPHTQHAVPLSGLAPNARATVVHVTSTGGTVSAALQESEITGVTPQGVDFVGPTAPPSKHVVVPGAVVVPAAQGAGTAGTDTGGGVPVLRVLPIGGKNAKLTIGVKPEGASGTGTASTVTVTHGVVSEVPLDKLAKGTYTVTVESSEPVVAAVHSTTTDAAAGSDFAWYAAAQPLTGPIAIPLAPGPAAFLHFVNPTSAAVTLKLEGPGGSTVAVPAGASISRPISQRGVLTATDAQGLYVTVGYSAPGQLAGYVAYPTGASASALTVYSR